MSNACSPEHGPGHVTLTMIADGKEIASRSFTYRSPAAESTVGVVQILLTQIDQLCDVLAANSLLTDEIDRQMSDTFRSKSGGAIPDEAFEQFFQMYRYIDSGEAVCDLSCCIVFVENYCLMIELTEFSLFYDAGKNVATI